MRSSFLPLSYYFSPLSCFSYFYFFILRFFVYSPWLDVFLLTAGKWIGHRNMWLSHLVKYYIPAANFHHI